MGGGLESRSLGRVYGTDGAVHGTIQTVHTIVEISFECKFNAAGNDQYLYVMYLWIKL